MNWQIYYSQLQLENLHSPGLIFPCRIGVNSRLPQHLILKPYCDAFAEVLHHWLVLSKHLAREEFQKDIMEDELVAVDPSQGHSQSAVGVADLMKAVSWECSYCTTCSLK